MAHTHMSLTSVSSSSAETEDRCVEALVSVPYNTDADAARRWGVKLYFGGDVDLCNRRVRSMEEELSWTVSPQQQQQQSQQQQAQQTITDEEEERAVYKWMDFCDTLPVIQSAEQLDSVPSEHKGVINGGRPRKLKSSSYMNDLSTTHTLRSSAPPVYPHQSRASLSPYQAATREEESPSVQCPQSPRTERSSQLGFMAKPQRRRRHSSSGQSMCEHQRSLLEQAWAIDENAAPERLMADLLKCLKDKRQATSTSAFSDDLNTACIVKDALERGTVSLDPHSERYAMLNHDLLCPDHASALSNYLTGSTNSAFRKHGIQDDRFAGKDPAAESTAALSDRQDRLKTRIKSLEEDLEEERDEARRRASQHKEECQRLKAEIENRTRDLHELQRKDLERQTLRDEERSREAQEFQTKLSAVEAKRQQEVEELKEQCKAIQIELYETKDKLRLSEADLMVARGEVERANIRMTEQAALHEKKITQLGRTHKEELEKITSDCEHLALSLKKFKSAYDVLKKSKMTIEEAEGLERELRKLASENAAKVEIIHRLEAEGEELRNLISEKDKKVAEAEICVNVKTKTLQEQNSYIESILSRSNELQRECGALRETINQLTAKQKALTDNLEELQSRHVPEETSREWLDMKHAVMLQKTELAAKNRTMETILKNLEELEVEKRREDERRLREEQRKLAEKDAEIDVLKQQITDNKTLQRQLEDQVAEQARLIKDRNSEYTKLATEISDLKQTMKSNIQRVLNSFN